MTTWYRVRFLFCSFGPLYLLLCVGLVVQHDWAGQHVLGGELAPIITAAVAFVGSIAVFQGLRKEFTDGSPTRQIVTPLESLDENVLGYMLSFIPPLMIDDLGAIAKVAPAMIFYGVLVIILLRTDMMYVNPYFLLFKYRIFRVILPSQRSVIVITEKSEILPGETITLHEIHSGKLFFSPV